MKRQYTKQQIKRAISHWKNVLKESYENDPITQYLTEIEPSEMIDLAARQCMCMYSGEGSDVSPNQEVVDNILKKLGLQGSKKSFIDTRFSNDYEMLQDLIQIWYALDPVKAKEWCILNFDGQVESVTEYLDDLNSEFKRRMSTPD